MATILGDLELKDDYTHDLGPESNFNESMYFNFFDRQRKSGGFVRLGNRANEGNAEMTMTLYLPDGSVMFQFKRPSIEHNDAMDAISLPDPHDYLTDLRAFLNRRNGEGVLLGEVNLPYKDTMAFYGQGVGDELTIFIHNVLFQHETGVPFSLRSGHDV